MPSGSIRQEWAVIRSLLLLLRQHKWLLPIVFALGLLSSASEGISLTLLIPLLHTFSSENVNSSVGGGSLSSWFHATMTPVDPRFRFTIIVGMILLAVCLKNIVSYANSVAFFSVESRVSHDLRVRLFERILAMPLAQTEGGRSGELMNVLGNESWRTSQAMGILFGTITSACTAVVFVPLLFFLSWRLTLVALACVSMIPVLISVISREITTVGERTVVANSELGNRMWSCLNGLRVIHSFGRKVFELQQFEKTSRSARDASFRLSQISARNGPATEVLISVIIAGLALIIQARLVDVATLSAFIVIVYRLQPRVREVISGRVALLGLQGSVVTVTQMAMMEDSSPDSGVGRALPTLHEAIRFEGVTFSHVDQETPALQDVSFEIKSATTVAIVGSSGAGKSTLLDLILGFRQPQSGRVLIDDAPMTHVNLEAWRSRIGVVSQDPYIFDETVRFNILYGRPEATEDELQEAADIAHASTFIGKLAHGYETMVGDRGTRLSGGEKQRLIVARALLRNPDVLILDEATNAIDSATEKAFQQAIVHFARQRTVIIVAHRLATVEYADNILVMDRGRLVEQGSFSTLLSRNGLFARMYQLQSFGAADLSSDTAVSIK